MLKQCVNQKLLNSVLDENLDSFVEVGARLNVQHKLKQKFHEDLLNFLVFADIFEFRLNKQVSIIKNVFYKVRYLEVLLGSFDFWYL